MRFYQLDTMRYLSAAIIVIGHVLGFHRSIPSGGVAVDFLFMLSGFVLGFSTHRWTDLSFLKFTITRFARIFPLFWFSLLFLPYISISDDIFWQNILLLQNIIPSGHPGYNFPAWSISAEFWMNIAVLYWVMRYRLIKTAALLVLFCYSSLWSQGLLEHAHIQSLYFTTAGFWRCIAGVLLGYLVYIAYERTDLTRFDKVPNVVFSLMEVSLFALVTVLLFIPSPIAVKVAVLLTPFFIFLFALGRGVVSTLLSLKYIREMGNYTYGVYLLHIPIILYLMKHYYVAWEIEEKGATPLMAFTILAGVTLISIPLYHYIETPSKKFLVARLSFLFKRTAADKTIKPGVIG